MNRYEYYANLEKYKKNELKHYGIIGQKWGQRRWQYADGRFNEEGKERYFGKSKSNPNGTVFVSGSSKTQFDDNEFYRPNLPKPIQDKIKDYMKSGKTILVGDAPGIDRQVQDFLKANNYNDVEVYSPGKKTRYSANPDWKVNHVNVEGAEEGSGEWLKGKDEAMTERATEGLAITIEDGAAATRNNIDRLKSQSKNVNVFELKKDGSDEWVENNTLYNEIAEKVYNNRFRSYNDLPDDEKEELTKEFDNIRERYSKGEDIYDIAEDSDFENYQIPYIVDDIRRRNLGIKDTTNESERQLRKENEEKEIKEFLDDKKEAFDEYGLDMYKDLYKNDKKGYEKAIAGYNTVMKLTEDLIRNDSEKYDKDLNSYIKKYGNDPDNIEDIQSTANSESGMYNLGRGYKFYDNTTDSNFIGYTKEEWDNASENEKKAYEFAKHYEDKDWKCSNSRKERFSYETNDKKNKVKWHTSYQQYDDDSYGYDERYLSSTKIANNMDKYMKDFQNNFKSNLETIKKQLKNKGVINDNSSFKLENINLTSEPYMNNNYGFMPELYINNGNEVMAVSIDPNSLRVLEVEI